MKHLPAMAVVACLFVAGCATTPISAEDATPVPPDRLFAFQSSQDARIVITRDTGILASACATTVYIDGTKAAAIEPGEVARFGVTAGEHIIGANHECALAATGLIETQIDVNTGETERLRIYYDMGGNWGVTPTAI